MLSGFIRAFGAWGQCSASSVPLLSARLPNSCWSRSLTEYLRAHKKRSFPNRRLFRLAKFTSENEIMSEYQARKLEPHRTQPQGIYEHQIFSYVTRAAVHARVGCVPAFLAAGFGCACCCSALFFFSGTTPKIIAIPGMQSVKISYAGPYGSARSGVKPGFVAQTTRTSTGSSQTTECLFASGSQLCMRGRR